MTMSDYSKDDEFEAERIRIRNEYVQDENFRIEMEKEYLCNPKHMKYAECFYKIGEGSLLSGDTMFFPVKIVDGRKLFGRLQCLIVPVVLGNHGLVATNLGRRWVDRKSLILDHDHDFKRIKPILILNSL